MAESKNPTQLIIESSNDSDSKSKTNLSSVSTISSSSNSTIPSSSSPLPTSSSNSLSDINEEQLKTSNKELEKIYLNLDCADEKLYSNDCNKFLLKKELLERDYLKENEKSNESLYPNLNDEKFNIKIASKKEFNDTKYDGTIYKNIKEHADALANADFEIQPHQAFVKNFMSFQTPYNSLLLFHGLGSGKTCSAIGVSEEMRDYMKQMGINKRIIIVASENVQDNFKLQLFDERKLKLVDGVWNIRACTGNKLLKEINPMNMKGMSREKVISQIKTIINTYYIFLGYVQFANYIIKTMNYDEEIKKQFAKPTKKKKPGQKSKIQMLKDVKIELNSRIIKRLSNEFDNRLIVIDEVHNIRKTDDNENKKVALNLELLVKAAKNMRFLLLSATPMYNSYKEIAWLLNLMNTNDRRGRIKVSDIFDNKGEIKNEELLIRKATGYISFVRGENPYTFPYRVYPNEFAKDKTFPAIKYPSYQMNLKKIKHEEKKRVLSLYLTKLEECSNCGKCQYCVYRYIIFNLRNKKFSITTKTGQVRAMPSFENMESFGYTLLQTPLESLIISYPIQGLKNIMDEMPREKLSEEFEPAFSESSEKNIDEAEEVEESPGPISEATVESEATFDSKATTLSEAEEEPIQVKTKPPLIIEDSDDDTNELIKINKDILKDVPIVKQDSDDDSFEIKKEIIREERKQIKKPKMVIESSSTSPVKTLVDEPEIIETEVETPKIVARSHQGVDTSGGKKTTSSSSSQKASSFHIDPHQLTGKGGLERMMNFVDEKSPPLKGEFEYKHSTLNTYGKIFEKDKISNYSVKIKSILDNIYNEKTGVVSEGVILIYSQYIDSGLIPMALALEEMGFTRYGQQGIKPLFKNRPSEIVDVRTMKPPTDKKNFIPARYSMITGDSRLSPNNDFEIKGLTDDNKITGNIDGNKVKVVLISKAGSEGIDFKFIRQIHILEPWYNMNRIEQIIGRGVRNFSHALLPFEKRNVEIFMYGTILGENKEEAADVYVYRVAEFKAVQIGKVTRVLKETAVDCIINDGQNNFTQKKMENELKEPITQILSNGVTLNNFKVGDAPFSPACDYMADCNFNCRPDAKINENELNEDTYDEKFIAMNSEKILQRIRMLMKESFFYKKENLINAIKVPKPYPEVQIYSALTQLIEDENEFIIDRYGRNGRLINVGEYYLFQPVELRDKNASAFDRSVPIDYKHSTINFELKENSINIHGKNPVIDKRNISKLIVEEDTDNKEVLEVKKTEDKKLIDELIENYNITLEFMKKTKVPRGDDNWYKHCGIVIKKMSKEYPESKQYLLHFLVSHILEQLLFNDKLIVMNYLYSLEEIEKNSFEWFAKEYFENNSIVGKKFTAFIMYNLNKREIMLLNKDNKWVPAEPEDQREIAASKEAKDLLVFNKDNYNKFVGFIGYEKSNRYLVFKTKDMTSARDTGARCDEAGKAKNINKLNEIIGEEKYDNENTKAVKDADGNIISEAVGNVELCVLQEFILRYFNAIKKDNYNWFLTPELAIWNKLYKIFT
jgi:hypothetical protein